jgi:hypothetical protein
MLFTAVERCGYRPKKSSSGLIEYRRVGASLKGIHFRRLWVGQRERRRAQNTPVRRPLRKSKQS